MALNVAIMNREEKFVVSSSLFRVQKISLSVSFAMNESLNLSFENLRYQVSAGFWSKSRKKKDLLKGISGEFKGSELSVVIGPSGSSKSTLINVLSGFIHENVSGAIKINDNVIPPTVVRRVSSYVLQDNDLHEFLTVYETLMFAASFKSKHKKSIKHKVENSLNSFGMMEHAETLVKDLSGGQRKRLSIASELVDDPAILFLDEPTTGLDSSSSTQCIQLLKKLAQEGKTIICTIHSPSALVFEMFDHIYALADGQCIYQGRSTRLVPFLAELDLICPESYSPSDFLLEIATNDYGPMNHRLVDKMENGANNYGSSQTSLMKLPNLISADLADLRSPSRSIYTLPFCDQVQHLMYRRFLISKRDKTLVIMRLAIHAILSVSIGFIYRDCGVDASKFFDNYRYIISTVVFQLYTSYFSLQTASEYDDLVDDANRLICLFLTVPLEFPILKRERFNRWYSTSAFFTSFVLFDLPIIFLCSLCFVSVTYVMTNQPLEFNRYLTFFCISLAMCYAGQGIGLMGSALLEVKVIEILSRKARRKGFASVELISTSFSFCFAECCDIGRNHFVAFLRILVGDSLNERHVGSVSLSVLREFPR